MEGAAAAPAVAVELAAQQHRLLLLQQLPLAADNEAFAAFVVALRIVWTL